MNEKPIGPFLKWAGGKGRLLTQMENFLPPTLTGRGYAEPFLGGGAVFFHVAQTRQPKSCTLLDVNFDLINVWRQVRDDVENLMDVLTEHRHNHNVAALDDDAKKAYFYGVRALAAEDLSLTARAARFIYLNKTCFNGLHRLNSRGLFNVPMGRYKDPAIFDASHLRAVSRLLENVTIEVCAFGDCERLISDGDFAYFDPPYAPLSPTSSFTSYAEGGFSQDAQRALRDLLLRLSPRCDWLLSNSVAPLIDELYDGENFQKHRILAGRAVNSVGSGRGKVEEFLIAPQHRAAERGGDNSGVVEG